MERAEGCVRDAQLHALALSGKGAEALLRAQTERAALTFRTA